VRTSNSNDSKEPNDYQKSHGKRDSDSIFTPYKTKANFAKTEKKSTPLQV
jgi:hypothetical protein